MDRGKRNPVWLELRPQQNFQDDDKNIMLDVLGHVTQLAFFVLCRNRQMAMLARIPEGEDAIFRTLPGITTVVSEGPKLGNVIAKSLVPRGRSSAVPLVDLRGVKKGNIYQKLWACRRDCFMACFAYDRTRHVLSSLNARIRSLERTEKAGGEGLSSRNRAELAAAVQKRDGHHSYYYCRVLLGMEINPKDGESVRTAHGDLDSLVGGMLQNSFAHRISSKKTELSAGPVGVAEKIRALLGRKAFCDPDTFVPRAQYPKNLVLTATELAYFASFPEEYDIRTINFGMGSTPTFVHGTTQEVGDTDLTLGF